MFTIPILCGMLSVFAGGLVQGIAGFGVGLVMVPVLLRVIPPESVAAVATGIGVVLNIQLFAKLRHDADFRIILPFLIGATCGIWPGSFIPRIIPARTFQIFVALLIVFSAASIGLGWKCSIKGTFTRFCAGFASGLLGGSISLSSPPIAIFLTAGSVPKQVFRASTSAYFLTLNIITLTMFGLQGTLSSALYWKHLALFLPALIAGTAVGTSIASKVPEAAFKRVVLTLVVISGLTLLI